MRSHGWFAIPGQTGDRTLNEQLKGLEPALSEAKGKTVTDFGCAEGLISIEFAHAGATVRACDYNPDSVEIAKRLQQDLPVTFELLDMNELVKRKMDWSADIVLCLAILHKLRSPEKAVRYVARMTKGLLVIRHQGGSRGRIRTKYLKEECDSIPILEECGLRFEKELHGPRDEVVHYWRR